MNHVACALVLALLTSSARSNATSYCIGAPNSAGPGAHIDWRGPFTPEQGGLVVKGAPASQVGVFIFSTSAAQTPFGDGYLCLGSSPARLAVKATDPSGIATLDIAHEGDPDLVLWMEASMSPTGSWYFQYLYRDTAGPLGSGFNSTDGVQVLFAY